MEALIYVERDLLSLYIDFCPTEKKKLGIWLHSVTSCISAKTSQAVFRRMSNSVLLQEGWMGHRLTRIDQPVFF